MRFPWPYCLDNMDDYVGPLPWLPSYPPFGPWRVDNIHFAAAWIGGLSPEF